MTTAEIVSLLLMLLSSALFGMFGVGGGVVYTPIQLFFGTSFTDAATVSLFLIAATSSMSGAVYLRAGLADIPLIGLLGLLSVGGSILGAWTTRLFPESILFILFILFLIGNGFALVFGKGRTPATVERPRRWGDWHRSVAGREFEVHLPTVAGAALSAGLFGGMLGLGGGIIMLPIMLTVLKMPVKPSIAVSAFLAALTGIGGFASRVAIHSVDWHFTIVAGVAVAIGSLFGARLTITTDSGKIKKWMGYFFVAVAVIVAIRRYA